MLSQDFDGAPKVFDMDCLLAPIAKPDKSETKVDAVDGDGQVSSQACVNKILWSPGCFDVEFILGFIAKFDNSNTKTEACGH